MKKAVCILSACIIFLFFNLALAQSDGVKSEKEEVLQSPVIETKTIGSEIDRTVKSQGLFFTEGGVRPAEPGALSYPSLDGVIFIKTKTTDKRGEGGR